MPTAAYGQISINNLTEALTYLYFHPEQQKQLSRLALKFANQPYINWKAIAKQWELLLLEVANNL